MFIEERDKHFFQKFLSIFLININWSLTIVFDMFSLSSRILQMQKKKNTIAVFPTTDVLFNNVINSFHHWKNPYWLTTILQKEWKIVS